jgi:hypothetical protein
MDSVQTILVIAMVALVAAAITMAAVVMVN